MKDHFSAPVYRNELPRPSTFVEHIDVTLSAFKRQDQVILKKRFGYENAPQTLQKIADSYGRTRQRVLQILCELVERWKAETYWDTLVEEVYELLAGRDKPLSLSEAGERNPWLSGLESRMVFIQNVLNEMCDGRVYILKIDGIYFFGRINQAVWDSKFAEAKKLLEKNTGRFWDEVTAPLFVKNILPKNAQEFGSLLWEKSSKLCHFSSVSEGPLTLVSYGRSAESMVRALLEESETPLYYTEIARRAQKRGKSLTLRRTSNAAANVGFLFAPGTFGLNRHVPLSEEEMLRICAKAETTIMSGPSDRQWHVDELLDRLLEENQDIVRIKMRLEQEHGRKEQYSGEFASESDKDSDEYVPELDKYMLDFILGKSWFLRSLGRMTWVVDGEETKHLKRISIHESIVEMLERAGCPMKVGSIRGKLARVRGVGEYFNVFPKDPLVRIGPNAWGLNDRDVPWSHAEQKALIDNLVDALKKRQAELKEKAKVRMRINGGNGANEEVRVENADFSVREVVQMLYLEKHKIDFPGNVEFSAGDAFLSLAIRDPRLKLTQGKKIGLAVPESQGPLSE